MTDKEFKRLSRSQLIDIIYQFQLRQDELEEENQKLKAEVMDKRIRLTQAGNIADASLAIHNVMQAAQDAATQYLEEIQMMRDETEEHCQRLLEEARKEADAIIEQAKNAYTSPEPAPEATLEECSPTDQTADEEECPSTDQAVDEEASHPTDQAADEEECHPTDQTVGEEE